MYPAYEDIAFAMNWLQYSVTFKNDSQSEPCKPMTCLGRFFEYALPPPPPRSNGFNERRESKEICGNHLVDNVHTLNNLNWIKELCTSLSLKRCHFIPATTTCRLSEFGASKAASISGRFIRTLTLNKTSFNILHREGWEMHVVVHC